MFSVLEFRAIKNGGVCGLAGVATAQISTHSQRKGVVRRGVALRGWVVRSPDDSPCVMFSPVHALRGLCKNSKWSVQRVSKRKPKSVQILKELGLSDARELTSVQQVSNRCPNYLSNQAYLMLED